MALGTQRRSRDGNTNWKGGRIVTSHGYVMIRVGKAHHLADCRGYAYEHRLVAEANLGRRLRPNEEVHHRDETARENNDWSNLIVCADRHEHAQHHRRSRRRLRARGEENDRRACECGCGTLFPRFDRAGRPRRFVPGHNMRSRP